MAATVLPPSLPLPPFHFASQGTTRVRRVSTPGSPVQFRPAAQTFVAVQVDGAAFRFCSSGQKGRRSLAGAWGWCPVPVHLITSINQRSDPRSLEVPKVVEVGSTALTLWHSRPGPRPA